MTGKRRAVKIEVRRMHSVDTSEECPQDTVSAFLGQDSHIVTYSLVRARPGIL